MDEVVSWSSRAAARARGASGAVRDRIGGLGQGAWLLLLGVFGVGVLALAVLLGAFAPRDACDQSRHLVQDVRGYDGSLHLSRDAAVALRRDARQLDDVAPRADGTVRRDLLELAALAHQARAGRPFRVGAAVAAYEAGC